MGDIVNSVTDAVGLTDSGYAERQTRAGYARSAEAQKEGLEYLQGVDEVPRGYRDDAMNSMANMYGFGEEGAQDAYYEGITDDPFYKMLSQGGDEAVLRNQSAIGDLRGGGSFSALAQNENRNRMNTHQNNLGGIQNIMNTMPDYTADIYGGITGIGNTEGQGMIASGQARENANSAGMNNLVGFGSLFATPITGGVSAATGMGNAVKNFFV